MQSKLLLEAAERTFAVVFEPDENPAEGLLTFARQEHVTSAHFTAIGAFKEITLGWFNLETKEYEEIPIKEQVEAVSLVGNVAVSEGEPKIHAHVVVAKRDGSAYGGHLLKGRVRPTLEVMLTETPRHLCRTQDSATGLALIDLDVNVEPHRRGRDIIAETGP